MRVVVERALELGPDNVGALVGLGIVDAVVSGGYMADDPAPIAAAAEASLTKALTLAPNNAVAHRAMGYLLCETNRAPRGLEELERAQALDPNMAGAHGHAGLAKISSAVRRRPRLIFSKPCA